MDNHRHSQKKKHEIIAQGPYKWREDEETANWGTGNQVNWYIQTAEEPLSKPNNFLKEYIICLAENNADRANSACIGWVKPVIGVLQSPTAPF